jgi:hypothetical protein|tara:strand:+ start:40 stop:162 length:123 start_codon:yes stop_codon:yes gene_type:complete
VLLEHLITSLGELRHASEVILMAARLHLLIVKVATMVWVR